MRRFVLPLAVFLLVAAACASVPLPEREGVVLYRKKCGACHRPYAPSEIRERRKETILPEMKVRAKLNDEEAAAIRRYLEPDLVPSHAEHPAPR